MGAVSESPSVLVIFLAVASSFFAVSNGGILPPARFDGFVYSGQRVDPDSILVEAFFDPVCPDSRDSWPPLKLALDHYGPRVSFVLHLLPLPYHDNAFVTSRALHIVNMQNPSDTFRLLESFFTHQERFYNAQTRNMSRTAVVEEIAKFATETLGNSYHSTFQAGFDNKKTDYATRVSFKYSTSSGVYGTPTFYVNGFVLPDTGETRDYNGWRKVIDPLLQ